MFLCFIFIFKFSFWSSVCSPARTGYLAVELHAIDLSPQCACVPDQSSSCQSVREAVSSPTAAVVDDVDLSVASCSSVWRKIRFRSGRGERKSFSVGHDSGVFPRCRSRRV